MRSTLKDVAESAGVSFTLVSKYLNHDPAARMSAQTRKRIDDALRQLDYRPSAAARTLRSGKSRTVGMICGNLTNSFFAHAADCALKVFQQHGYQLLLALYDAQNPDAALRMLMEHNVDGIYAFTMPEVPSGGFPAGVPVVLNHQKHERCSDFCIAADEPLAEALNARHVSRVAGLFVPQTTWSGAFSRACAKIRCNGTVHLLPQGSGARREAMKSLCAARPEAIFSNGWETISCLLELLDDEFPGYAPEIVLHANCTGAFLNDPRIVGVVTSPTRELITRSCEALIAEIENGGQPAASHILPARFVAAGTAEYAELVTRHFQLT